ncbi:ADP-ribosylglycohydrolase family protein [Vibrio nigripulchritudo]|uniref:ADP-ribosylglycohydrolase family protein n=1 Tax=Vibrio nigripulchritudo TaxID=28173 RepID=UPI0005F9F2C0|nr:ADP-ribosylglycohydrolase family protein [Vibrio nigripulchritudo]KJY67905.1 hypothetical protein TW74_26600 [Vibrio nigripulchritudo]
MTLSKAQKKMILGALVADAASLGFHWLYDQPTIKRLAPSDPTFQSVSASEFENKGYFAHADKSAGEPSQYGAQLYAILDSLKRKSGRFDLNDYALSFQEWFDFGGEWVGYIDKPTKLTLLAMHSAQDSEAEISRCGADDQQLPTVSKLPPLIAYIGDHKAHIEQAVRVTNNKDSAVQWALALATIMQAVLDGSSIREAIELVRSNTSEEISTQIDDAINALNLSSEEYAQKTGLHCDLSVAFPVILHILLTSSDYRSAVKTNIYCGGDSCGRAIIIGAIMAVTDSSDIPAEWVAKTRFKRDQV